MVLAVCVDDNMGMLFNNRRQSQDREVRRQLLEEAGEHTLWMNAYSGKQFADAGANVRIDEDFLSKAQPGDWCFMERFPEEGGKAFFENIEQILLFRWNRSYPADVYFDFSPEKWKLAERQDFKGYSHETITKEVYVK